MDAPPKRRAKDSVFTSLFSDRRYLFRLYQALHPEDTAATQDDIRNVTMHAVLTDGMYNDLGFLLGRRLVILVEAQSTWSPNIVVRSLMYLVKTYNAYFKEHGQNLYGSAPVELPRPELYVIYTGMRKERPEYISFREQFFPEGECAIDVRAKVICDGSPGDIISQYVEFCHVLDEQIRLHGRTKKALEEAVRICMDADVLREFLDSRRHEMTDYIWDMTDEEIEQQYWNNRIRQAVQENTTAVTQSVTEENARSFALRLLGRGQMSVADIADCAGLPLAEVEALSRIQPA